MTPQPQLPAAAIATQAAEELFPKALVRDQDLPSVLYDSNRPNRDKAAALILSAAAKMVRESGAVEALERAGHLMDATTRYMADNPVAAEYTIRYDEAECDGTCLAEDCDHATQQANAALQSLRALTEQPGKP